MRYFSRLFELTGSEFHVVLYIRHIKGLYIRHIKGFRMFYIVSLYRMSFEMNMGAQGRDNSVGIATRYELDGPGIESRWEGARFSAPV